VFRRRLAAAGFVAVGTAGEAQCQAGADYAWDDRLLPTVCPLIARKFKGDASRSVMRALQDDSLGIIPQQQQQQRQRASAAQQRGRRRAGFVLQRGLASEASQPG